MEGEGLGAHASTTPGSLFELLGLQLLFYKTELKIDLVALGFGGD